MDVATTRERCTPISCTSSSIHVGGLPCDDLELLVHSFRLNRMPPETLAVDVGVRHPGNLSIIMVSKMDSGRK